MFAVASMKVLGVPDSQEAAARLSAQVLRVLFQNFHGKVVIFCSFISLTTMALESYYFIELRL